MTGVAAHRVRSMTTALRRVLVGPTSASFGSSRRAESAACFVAYRTTMTLALGFIASHTRRCRAISSRA